MEKHEPLCKDCGNYSPPGGEGGPGECIAPVPKWAAEARADPVVYGSDRAVRCPCFVKRICCIPTIFGPSIKQEEQWECRVERNEEVEGAHVVTATRFHADKGGKIMQCKDCEYFQESERDRGYGKCIAPTPLWVGNTGLVERLAISDHCGCFVWRVTGKGMEARAPGLYTVDEDGVWHPVPQEMIDALIELMKEIER